MADLRHPLFHAASVGNDKEDAPENDIHGDAGGDNRHALPDGLVFERARIVFLSFFLVAFADHVHVTAHGDKCQLVGGFAACETAPGKCRTKADGERLDVDIAPLGHRKVSQFVNEDNEAQAEAGFGDAPYAFKLEIDEPAEQSQDDEHEEQVP